MYLLPKSSLRTRNGCLKKIRPHSNTPLFDEEYDEDEFENQKSNPSVPYKVIQSSILSDIEHEIYEITAHLNSSNNSVIDTDM